MSEYGPRETSEYEHLLDKTIKTGGGLRKKYAGKDYGKIARNHIERVEHQLGQTASWLNPWTAAGTNKKMVPMESLKYEKDFKPYEIDGLWSVMQKKHLWKKEREDMEQRLARVVTDEEFAKELGLPGGVEEYNLEVERMRQCKHVLMVSNAGLVTWVAKKYLDTGGLDLNDLLQEGMFGLDKAVERFEPERGYKFSTYAYQWVRQSIRRAQDDRAHMIRVPSVMVGDILKMKRAVRLFYQEHGQEPNDVELARDMGVSQKRLRGIKDADYFQSTVTSMEATFKNSHEGSNGKLTLERYMPNGAPGPMDVLEMTDKRAVLEEAFRKSLSERDAKIISMRFGFTNDAPMRIREIADQLGLSVPVVQRAIMVSLNKLRQNHHSDLESLLYDGDHHKQKKETPPIKQKAQPSLPLRGLRPDPHGDRSPSEWFHLAQ